MLRFHELILNVGNPSVNYFIRQCRQNRQVCDRWSRFWRIRIVSTNSKPAVNRFRLNSPRIPERCSSIGILVSRGGLEPPTRCLRGSCSTIELPAHGKNCNTSECSAQPPLITL
jgi:hypothetical protein